MLPSWANERRRMLAVACATIGVMLVGSAPAVALPSWLQTGPGFAVACISEGRCESVGNSFAGNGTLRAWLEWWELARTGSGGTF